MHETPANEVKYSGLSSLKEVADACNVSVQTLSNWHKSRPELFDVIVIGVASIKHNKLIQRYIR